MSQKDYEEDFEKYKKEKYSPSSVYEPLPLIEPIKTKRILYEEKINKIYYIEYNKNERRYKN